MIKQNKDLIQNYTDSDLYHFEKLGNFNNRKIDPNETKNIQYVYRPIHYTLSDNKQFKKLMNFNNGIEASSKEYSTEDFDYNEDMKDKRQHIQDYSFYSKSDIQNFNNLQKFLFSNISDSFQYTNKKEELNVTKINYTADDLATFDRIIETNEINIKNVDTKNLNLKIDRSSIKIIDFDKLKKQEKINIKQRVKKIKVVYFD